MKSFFYLGFAATLATLSIADSTFHRSLLQPKMKRGFLTCAQTYGPGSTTCGAIDSHYCYDPTAGETCCLLDDGYCGEGDFCAPVAGYCCHNTETPGVCAARLSFSLPTSYDIPSVSATTAPALSTSTSAKPDLPTSTIQIALAPGPPSAVVGFGAISATTEGTYVPEMTAPVNMTNVSTATVTSTAAGDSTSPSASPYLQASGGTRGANMCLGAMVAAVGFVVSVL